MAVDMNKASKSLTKGQVVEFDRAWRETKVKGLSNESTYSYLYLKSKISEHIKLIEEQQKEAIKIALSHFGYKDNEQVPTDKVSEVNARIIPVLEKILSETIDMDTKILNREELFGCVISLDENKDISIENKATLMKYLLKE